MEITVRISAQELLDSGKWEIACDVLGINVWAVNEGLMDSDEIITLSQWEAQELGLI